VTYELPLCPCCGENYWTHHSVRRLYSCNYCDHWVTLKEFLEAEVPAKELNLEKPEPEQATVNCNGNEIWGGVSWTALPLDGQEGQVLGWKEGSPRWQFARVQKPKEELDYKKLWETATREIETFAELVDESERRADELEINLNEWMERAKTPIKVYEGVLIEEEDEPSAFWILSPFLALVAAWWATLLCLAAYVLYVRGW